MKRNIPLTLTWAQQIKRYARHLLALPWRARNMLNSQERTRIAKLIEESERLHTGEIAVAIESSMPLSYLQRRASARERAWAVFSKLQVWNTPDNNGVLIYLLHAERRIEIVADRDIAQRIEQSQWDAWIHVLYQSAHEQQWANGLAQVIGELSTHMARHYPSSQDRIGEQRVGNVPTHL